MNNYLMKITYQITLLIFSLTSKVMNLFFLLLFALTKKNFPLIFFKSIEKEFNFTYKQGGITFDSSDLNPYYRAKSLLTKEPDTISWIEDYFDPDEIFYDIGANVGVFSLYAAKQGLKVYSFEPESQNYAFLNKNIRLNTFKHEIVSLNIALNNVDTISYLALGSVDPGSAMHSFDKKENITGFTQSVLGYSLDSLIRYFNLDTPNHIKIDVDGNEYRIISGMKETLQNKELKSLCIEIDGNIDLDNKIVEILDDNCFSRINMRMKTKVSNGVYNIFFLRRICER
jgi:FkbM family methyltransferase